MILHLEWIPWYFYVI